MPWKVHSLLEARQRFVNAVIGSADSVAQLCRIHKISRKTGFKWLRRFRTEGGMGLSNRSRRPKHSPTRTPTRWLDQIAEVRRRHPSWGAKKIYARLHKVHRRTHLPKLRTITKWLPKLRFAIRRRRWARRGPQRCRPALTKAQRPNHV